MALSVIPPSLFTDPNPLSSVFLLVGLAVIPFALLAVTSFVKISVVFNILRSAIGAQQVPSGAVISLLSLVLSLHVMAPVARKISETIQLSPTTPVATGVAHYVELATRAAIPLEDFLRKQSHPRERWYFATIEQPAAVAVPKAPPAASGNSPCGSERTDSNGICVVPGESIISLVPAFVLSQLSEAFALGFRIFLPFLVVDLLIAHLLLALGMSMLNPVTVSLPFKLLLLVMSDGWFLLCQGLIEGYR